MRNFSYVLMCLMYVSILSMAGCSGCRKVPMSAPATAATSLDHVHNEVAHTHTADTETAHTHLHAADTLVSAHPPIPADLAIGSLKTPEALTEHQIGQAFSEVIALAVTHPEKAQEQMHEIAEQLGLGDPDWTEYFHLLGHSLIENPASPNMYMTLEDALRFDQLKLKLYGENEEVRKELERTRLKIQWNEDGDKLNLQIQPIKDLLEWMSQNAPVEWAVVNPIYEEMYSKERDASIPKDWLTDFLTPSERADIRYNAIFEALTYLPNDSLTFQEMFSAEQESVQETYLEERSVAVKSPSEVRSRTPTVHTWNMVHDFSVPPDGPESTEASNDGKALHTLEEDTGLPTTLIEKQAYEILREIEKLLGEDFSVEIQELREYMQRPQQFSPRDVPQSDGLYDVDPFNQFEGDSK